MQVLICLYNAKFSGVMQYYSWRHLNKYPLTITKDARTNQGSLPLAFSLVKQWGIWGLFILVRGLYPGIEMIQRQLHLKKLTWAWVTSHEKRKERVQCEACRLFHRLGSVLSRELSWPLLPLGSSVGLCLFQAPQVSSITFRWLVWASLGEFDLLGQSISQHCLYKPGERGVLVICSV